MRRIPQTFLMTLLLLMLCASVSASAEENVIPRYSTLEISPVSQGNWVVSPEEYVAESGIIEEGAYGYDGAVMMLQPHSAFTVRVDAPQAGWYQILLDYYLPQANISDYCVSLKINGETPFQECQNIPLYSLWQDAPGDYPVDSYGNQLAKTPEHVCAWQTTVLNSKSYALAQGLLFPLEAGENTIEFVLGAHPIALGAMTFCAPTELQPYEAYRAALADVDPVTGFSQIIEGEAYTNKTILMRMANRATIPICTLIRRENTWSTP